MTCGKNTGAGFQETVSSSTMTCSWATAAHVLSVTVK